MKLRFLADADLRPTIVRGLKRRAPRIDFLTAQDAIPDGTPDPDVLTFAANLGRVVVSHDVRTMPAHFYVFLRVRESPGLIVVPQRCSIGMAVADLHEVWQSETSESLNNRILYLPRSPRW